MGAPARINRLDLVMRASTAWLSAGSNTAQVAALGYNTEGVLQCLTDAAAVSNTAREGLIEMNTAADAIVSQIQEQLFYVGQALTSCGHPGGCNNPACITFSGPSDDSLVAGSSSKCSSCRAARYCSHGHGDNPTDRAADSTEMAGKKLPALCLEAAQAGVQGACNSDCSSSSSSSG